MPLVTGRLIGNQIFATFDNLTFLAQNLGASFIVNTSYSVLPPAGITGLLDVQGVSQNLIYPMFRAENNVKLFQTVAQLGSQATMQIMRPIWAAGASPLISAALALTLPDALVNQVIAQFATLNVRRASDGVALTYYANWENASNAQTTATLLSSGDGMCAAWSRFFLDVLNGIGLDGGDKIVKLLPQVPGLIPFQLRLVVKNWSAVNPDVKVPADVPPGFGFRYANTIDRMGLENTEGNSYNWITPQVTKQANVAGQSSANPLAIFGDHIVVPLTFTTGPNAGKVVFFDPSYGKTYTGATLDAARLDFQKNALDFIGYQALNMAGRLRMYFRPITATTPLLVTSILVDR